MKPTDFYQKRYLTGSGTRNKGKRATGIAADWPFYDGSINMAFLNQLSIPDASAIAAFQINFLKNNIQINQNIKNFINSFQNNKINLRNIPVGIGYNLEDALSDIEKAFSNVSFNYDPTGNLQVSKISSFDLLSKNNTFNMSDYMSEYKNLLDILAQVQVILTQEEKFINSNEIQIYMQKINNARQSLAADLAKIDAGEQVSIPKDPYISPGALMDLGRKVKGRLMEVAVENFLSNNLPTNLNVVDTSLIRDEHGQQITAGADLITLSAPSGDKIVDNIKIKWKDKKGSHNANIFDFFDYVDKNKNLVIKVDADEYKDILSQYQNNITGIQAKSGFNQGILNKNKANTLTLQQVINTPGIYSTALKIFQEWYRKSQEIHGGNGWVSANNKAFNAYFDYQLAHFIQQLVGQNVVIVATREGIMTLDEYLKHEWLRAKKYFKTIEKISIGNDARTYPIRQSAAKVF